MVSAGGDERTETVEGRHRESAFVSHAALWCAEEKTEHEDMHLVGPYHCKYLQLKYIFLVLVSLSFSVKMRTF